MDSTGATEPVGQLRLPTPLAPDVLQDQLSHLTVLLEVPPSKLRQGLLRSRLQGQELALKGTSGAPPPIDVARGQARVQAGSIVQYKLHNRKALGPFVSEATKHLMHKKTSLTHALLMIALHRRLLNRSVRSTEALTEPQQGCHLRHHSILHVRAIVAAQEDRHRPGAEDQPGERPAELRMPWALQGLEEGAAAENAHVRQHVGGSRAVLGHAGAVQVDDHVLPAAVRARDDEARRQLLRVLAVLEALPAAVHERLDVLLHGRPPRHALDADQRLVRRLVAAEGADVVRREDEGSPGRAADGPAVRDHEDPVGHGLAGPCDGNLQGAVAGKAERHAELQDGALLNLRGAGSRSGPVKEREQLLVGPLALHQSCSQAASEGHFLRQVPLVALAKRVGELLAVTHKVLFQGTALGDKAPVKNAVRRRGLRTTHGGISTIPEARPDDSRAFRSACVTRIGRTGPEDSRRS